MQSELMHLRTLRLLRKAFRSFRIDSDLDDVFTAAVKILAGAGDDGAPLAVRLTFDRVSHAFPESQPPGEAVSANLVVHGAVRGVLEFRIIGGSAGQSDFDHNPEVSALAEDAAEILSAALERRVEAQDLQLKNALLQGAFESSPDGILAITSNDKVLLRNRRMNEIWRFPDHLATSDNDQELVEHALSQVADPDALRDLVLRLKESRLETLHDEIMLKDGRTLERYTAPLVGSDGSDFGRILFYRDVTERISAQAEAREKDLSYQALFENMLNGLSYCQIIYEDSRPIDFVYLGVNKAFEHLTGLKDVQGRRASEIIPGIWEKDRGLLDSYARVASSGQAERFEHYLESLQMWFLISVYSARKDYFVAVFDVITARKQAEAENQRMRLQQAAILNNIPDIAWLKDTQSRFITVNEPFARSAGKTVEEIIGETDFTLWPPELAERYRKDDAEVIREGKRKTIEEPLNTSDGKQQWIETIKTPVKNEHGHIIGVVGIARDTTERHLAAERIRQQFRRLAAIREIDLAIAGTLDLRVSLGLIVRELVSNLGCDAASALVYNEAEQSLNYAAGSGFITQALQHTHLHFGSGHAGMAAREQKRILIPDVRKQTGGLSLHANIAVEEFVTYIAEPLMAKGKVQGVIEIFFRRSFEPNDEWYDFLEALAGQAAIALDNAHLFSKLLQSNAELVLSYDKTLEGWVHALDLRDKETEGHSLRVTELTVRLARRMGLSDDELSHARRGALLHDIGKLGVPDRILLKPGPLEPEEMSLMRMHPVWAFEWLSSIEYLKPALDIPYCHHEKWDGTGYPRGLKGEVIPLSARIFAVIDVWDALRSDRPYRKAWDFEKTRAHIQSLVGTHFDPRVVEYFLKMLDEMKVASP